MNILVTGGAGYVGCALTQLLLSKGYQVTVFDNLLYGGTSLLPYISDKNFKFIKGDIRDSRDVKSALKGVDGVVHLAAIVGYPACLKSRTMAREVNVHGTKVIVNACEGRIPLLHASTGSNYGAMASTEICTEETPLNPLSVYGETKTAAEEIVMNGHNTMAYRFATAFGVSSRMRLDLLINDFSYKAYTEKSLILYERSYKRTFVHVKDMALGFLFGIENFSKMSGNVYNFGSNSLNFSKEEIALLIKQYVDYCLFYAENGHDADQRNYVVSYDKLDALGFHVTMDIHEGIKELLKVFAVLPTSSPYSNV